MMNNHCGCFLYAVDDHNITALIGGCIRINRGRLGKIWDDQCLSLPQLHRRFAGGFPAAANPGTFEQKFISFQLKSLFVSCWLAKQIENGQNWSKCYVSNDCNDN